MAPKTVFPYFRDIKYLYILLKHLYYIGVCTSLPVCCVANHRGNKMTFKGRFLALACSGCLFTPGQGEEDHVQRDSYQPGHEGQHGHRHAQVRRSAEGLARGARVQGKNLPFVVTTYFGIDYVFEVLVCSSTLSYLLCRFFLFLFFQVEHEYDKRQLDG